MTPGSCWRRSALFLLVAMLAITRPSVAQDSTAQNLKRLGMQALEENRYVDAERQLRLALDEFGKSGNSFEVTRTLGDLANVLMAQERHAEAEQLLTQAFNMIEGIIVAHSHEASRLFSNLGALYVQTKKYKESELAFNRALQLLEQNEPESPQIVRVLGNLAALHAETGKYKQAQTSLQRALDLTEKRLGRNHPDLIAILINFAGVYQRQRKWELAESHLLQAARIAERSLRPDHPEVGLILEHLGVVHSMQKKLPQAEMELRRAHEIEVGRLGREGFRSLHISLTLAKVLTEERRYEEARTLYSEVLPAQERLLGPKAPELAATLEAFSRLLHMMNNREPAVEMEARAKRIRAENAYTRSVKDLQQW